ncbi:MAG: hypothetical protein ACYDGR_12805 [Candidatus Dormibacteria bacterium]
MGTSVTYEFADLVIPADQAQGALAVVRAHVAAHRLGADRDGLVEALGEARFDAIRHDNGDVEIDFFKGDRLWDEGELFDELAPFVRDGGAIYAEAEGSHWKLAYANGGVEEFSGRLIYEDEQAEQVAS